MQLTIIWPLQLLKLCNIWYNSMQSNQLSTRWEWGWSKSRSSCPTSLQSIQSFRFITTMRISSYIACILWFKILECIFVKLISGFDALCIPQNNSSLLRANSFAHHHWVALNSTYVSTFCEQIIFHVQCACACTCHLPLFCVLNDLCANCFLWHFSAHISTHLSYVLSALLILLTMCAQWTPTVCSTNVAGSVYRTLQPM